MQNSSLVQQWLVAVLPKIEQRGFPLEVRTGKAGPRNIGTPISLAAGWDVHGSANSSQAGEAADFPVKKQGKIFDNVYWYFVKKSNFSSLIFGVF